MQTLPISQEAETGHHWAELPITVVAGLGVTFIAIYLCTVPLAGHIASSRDFISYWAAGRQLVHGVNPYDRVAVGGMEHAAGLDKRMILVMRNPPWALPLAWPLGFLGLRFAGFLWSLLLVGCLGASVHVTRRLHGAPSNSIQWLGLAFTPALICITMGQTALLSLLGLALFLVLHRKRPFAAGAALWLCALKPHLFLPFGVALLAWIVFEHAWKLLAGSATALAATTALAFVLAPHAWTDYLSMMRSPIVENDFVPCLADVVHHWFWPQFSLVRYLPAAIACLWALFYFSRHRSHWNWEDQGSLLMLVSILLAPYAWLYDQCLLIPALLHAGYTTRSRTSLGVLALMILAADLQLVAVKVISPLWLWTAPAWLAWYLLTVRNSKTESRNPIAKSDLHLDFRNRVTENGPKWL